MNKKMNNKGFSLVELIVVIAIMGILAVTLAPRLTQYVEKSRKASDQEVVNTIFTAAKLANVLNPLGANESISLSGTDYPIYTVSADGKTWTKAATFADTVTTDTVTKAFIDEMMETLSNFTLKSNSVAVDETTGVLTTITLSTDANGKLKVALDYNGATPTDYEAFEP